MGFCGWGPVYLHMKRAMLAFRGGAGLFICLVQCYESVVFIVNDFFNRLFGGHAHVRTSCLPHRRWERIAAASATFLKMSTWRSSQARSPSLKTTPSGISSFPFLFLRQPAGKMLPGDWKFSSKAAWACAINMLLSSVLLSWLVC